MKPTALTELRPLVHASVLVTDPADMAPYLKDWRGRYQGKALAVLRPRSVEDVSAILRWASVTGTAVVPQGGHTGLAGGGTPDAQGESVVLSLGRMNRIRDIDLVGNTLIAEAGCVLVTVQQAASSAERLFPMSLGSEGSCQVGGIVATNAGGINVIRYGTMRNLVLGLEYVRADGQIVHGLKRLRKDNAGYKLDQLLIGSEGTLAVITAAVLKLFPKPRANATAFCGLATAEDVLTLLGIVRNAFGERISSFELMCDTEMGLTLDLLTETALPLDRRHAWYVFIEIADQDGEESLEEALSATVAGAIESGQVEDAVIAQSLAQAQAIWHLRFAVSEANRLAGPLVSHDTSVGTADVPRFIAAVTAAMKADFPEVRPLFVGHVGDGNIHVGALFPKGHFVDSSAFEAMARRVNECVFDITRRFDGSITAEHGVGKTMVIELEHSTQSAALDLMRGIKHVFDPAGILNPGKVLAVQPNL